MPAPALDMITAILAKACPGIVGISTPNPADKTTWEIWREGSPGVLAVNDTCANAAINSPLVAAAMSMPSPSAGLTITSTSNSTLNGVYALDDATRQNAAGVATYVMLNSRFPAGMATFAWPDINGVAHLGFTISQFQAFATAMADYVTALDFAKIALAAAGTFTAWPTPTATIP